MSNREFEKDLYAILGVDSDASAEEIRDAYRARARIADPDRFYSQRDPQVWKEANEMLAELNAAYSILSDGNKRSEYDRTRSNHSRVHTTTPESHNRPSATTEMGELTAGRANFHELPEPVKERLLKRQTSALEDEFKCALASPRWNYALTIVPLCWFWYLFANAGGATWKDDSILWFGAITIAVGATIAYNVCHLIRWKKSTLKPYFYVSPLYFIRTGYDTVVFRPIWSLRDVGVTHNYMNGGYRNSDVVLKFKGSNERLTLASRARVDEFFNCLRRLDSRVREALNASDIQYLRLHDEFFGVWRNVTAPRPILRRGLHIVVYAVSLIACTGAFALAVTMNQDPSRKKWVQHPTSPSTSATSQTPAPARTTERRSRASAPAATPTPVRISPVPEQPLPQNSTLRVFTNAERVAPFEIKTAVGSHYYVKVVIPGQKTPVLDVFVRSGATVNVDVPLGAYEVRYASGDSWFGYEYLFGPDTAYAKADKVFTFEVDGNHVVGYTITLYKVPDGNLSTSAMKPEDF